MKAIQIIDIGLSQDYINGLFGLETTSECVLDGIKYQRKKVQENVDVLLAPENDSYFQLTEVDVDLDYILNCGGINYYSTYNLNDQNGIKISLSNFEQILIDSSVNFGEKETMILEYGRSIGFNNFLSCICDFDIKKINLILDDPDRRKNDPVKIGFDLDNSTTEVNYYLAYQLEKYIDENGKEKTAVFVDSAEYILLENMFLEFMRWSGLTLLDTEGNFNGFGIVTFLADNIQVVSQTSSMHEILIECVNRAGVAFKNEERKVMQ